MREDAILVKAIQQGDEAALEELVCRYYDEIFYYIYRLGSPYEETKDLTQEVFIAMMKALPKYKEQGNFKAWLYKIAYNRAMNHFRQHKHSVSFSAEQENLKIGLDISEQLVNQSLVKELLNSLPKKQSSTLILKYYHGFTAVEIAKIMGTSTPTVKSRLYQGLQKLKKRMREGDFN
ncbi:RNA polymerase sigma factor [Lederbergia sp. NSJ-179]|uniref:RNA polymerase sigma factor n=1 Tax=Lederbergia sp. NSJ-179 TaxID=2931402 RepID=UPI001FD065DA|nr:RNA polymerase sigma factor [Lederbergia sp. NSJ-179]MCJ7842696.1 RNA polymerase sigma factor [Lederbergia sp. NSJ-179]